MPIYLGKNKMTAIYLGKNKFCIKYPKASALVPVQSKLPKALLSATGSDSMTGAKESDLAIQATLNSKA